MPQHPAQTGERVDPALDVDTPDDAPSYSDTTGGWDDFDGFDVEDIFPMPNSDGEENAPQPPTTDASQPDLTTDYVATSPQGTILGDAVKVLQCLTDARMPKTVSDVAHQVFIGIYAHQPKHWPPSAPPPGTFQVHTTALAREMGETPGNISTRLRQLCDWRVLERGKGQYVNHVWFRPVGEWDPALFDREAARARHKRLGAGAPARTRDVDPTIPLSERETDVYRRPFIIRALVAEALGADHADKLDNAWSVVEHFQRTFDEAFRIQWTPQLVELLNVTPSSLIIATATEIKQRALDGGRKAPYRPWGYLVKCVVNAPAPLTPTPARKENGASNAHPATTYRTDAPAIPAPSAPTSSATPRLARAAARTRARLDAQRSQEANAQPEPVVIK